MSSHQGQARPFRFGVSMSVAESRSDWEASARHAEAIGYDILLVADHLAPMLPPLTALSSAAAVTDRLRVGTLVANNDFRHPAMLAREAAAVALLTEGRMELGLGAGHMKQEYDEVGIPFDPAEVRVARLAESVPIVRALLDGEEVTCTGEHYSLTGHRAHPVLPADQRVPILVGGNGRRVLSIAARWADTVGFVGFGHTADASGLRFSNFTASGLDQQVAWVRDRAGDRFAGLELNALLQWIEITPDRRRAAERIAALFGALTADDVLDSPFVLLGTADQMAEQLRSCRDRFGISYWVAFGRRPDIGQDLDALAPVMERLL